MKESGKIKKTKSVKGCKVRKAEEKEKEQAVKEAPQKEAPAATKASKSSLNVPAKEALNSEARNEAPVANESPHVAAPVKREEESVVRLTAEELATFRNILDEKRKSLLNQARIMLETQEETNQRTSDEIDQASVEYDQSFEYRLRDREKFLLRKIDKALARMDEGEYDICESCGEPIGKKRLEARPETTLCIICKEEQEHHEKMYQKKRQLRATIEF